MDEQAGLDAKIGPRWLETKLVQLYCWGCGDKIEDACIPIIVDQDDDAVGFAVICRKCDKARINDGQERRIGYPPTEATPHDS